MAKGFIHYRKGYKYQLSESYEVDIRIKQERKINTEFIKLDKKGKLTIKKGYAWDGPSGPVPDTRKNMRASVVHDALYQLMRNKELDTRTYRKEADEEFRDICIADGVSKRMAKTYYKGLRKYGRPAASPEQKKKIYCAPRKKS